MTFLCICKCNKASSRLNVYEAFVARDERFFVSVYTLSCAFIIYLIKNGLQVSMYRRKHIDVNV